VDADPLILSTFTVVFCLGRTELIQSRPHSFEDPFEAVQRPDGGQHMRGIGALGPPCFEPATGFTCLKEGIEQPLGTVMGQQALTKIMQSGAVEARIRQLEAQGILPIDTTAHGIGSLTLGEPFDIFEVITIYGILCFP
jgi:hypothetical protein